MNDSLRLLLVEDDPIDQRAFLRLIEADALPYEPLLVNCVSAALQAIEIGEFDLIIADYLLNDGTGFDILEVAGDTPLIMVTGMGSEELAVKAMKAGAYDYLTKDSERHYLKLLPLVVENTIKRVRSERIAAAAEVDRIRRGMLETFISDASHDLRTPLSALSTSLYLLERYAESLRRHAAQYPDPEPLMRDILRITDRIVQINSDRDRLERIIDSMLHMVKADQITQLALIPYDLNVFVNEIVTGFADRVTLKEQTISFTPAPEPIYAAISIEEFRSIVDNLIANAVNYTPEHGAIHVELQGSDSAISLSISDTGIGIPADQLEHIFQRFYRVNKARTMNIGGSGLGLAIVRRLVDLHGGTIQVSSIEDQGSTFQVIMPRVIAD